MGVATSVMSEMIGPEVNGESVENRLAAWKTHTHTNQISNLLLLPIITLYLAAAIIKNKVTSNENGRLYLGMEWAELESFSIRGLKTDDNISCCHVTHTTCVLMF